MYDIPHKIKILRKSKNLSQTQLAKELGCTQQNLAKWEAGTPPNTQYLIKISSFFGVGLNYFDPDITINNVDDVEKVKEMKETYITKNHESLLQSLFGETFEILGEELASFTKKKLKEFKSKNLIKTLQKAKRMTNPDSMANSPSLRLFKTILEDVQFCEDEIVLDYSAGLISSSKNSKNNSDSGIFFANMLKSLSSNQIKLHYFICTALRELYKNETYERQGVYIPFSSLSELLGDEDTVLKVFKQIEVLGLIEPFQTSTPEPKVVNPEIPEDDKGVFIGPSINAICLFLWAHGLAGEPINRFYDETLPIRKNPYIKLPKKYYRAEKDFYFN